MSAALNFLWFQTTLVGALFLWFVYTLQRINPFSKETLGPSDAEHVAKSRKKNLSNYYLVKACKIVTYSRWAMKDDSTFQFLVINSFSISTL